MRRTDQQALVEPRSRFQPFVGSANLPLPVYREFLDMLFSMQLPTAGFGIVFVGVCMLAAFQLNGPIYAALAVLGAVTAVLRLAGLNNYARSAPVADMDSLQRWERSYANGSYATAALLGLLNVVALTTHHHVWHIITVSLVFGFGAGLVSRISVRPKICVMSLLLAIVPTFTAITFHAFKVHSDELHMQMYLIEAVLIMMIAGLSLHTVAHLHHSAVEHHIARYDLARLARFDALTGLPNRLLLRERFDKGIAAVKRSNQLLAVHYLDLDGFKAVNDQYGHPVGDALLEQVAHRLEAIVRADDTVARLGGDEFVVLQTELLHEDEAELLARRIIRQLSLPYHIGDAVSIVSVSVGIASAPRQGVELERLLACADAALYCAKAGGKAQALFCTDENAASLHLAA